MKLALLLMFVVLLTALGAIGLGAIIMVLVWLFEERATLSLGSFLYWAEWSVLPSFLFVALGAIGPIKDYFRTR